MIVGLGVDLCMISRIKGVFSRHGDAFLKRIFTEEERCYVDRLNGDVRFGGYAKRWAAKEACVKALGTGFTQGVSFQDIVVARHGNGAPYLHVKGEAERALWRLVPKGMMPELFVSLSDDPPFAMAQVIIQVRDDATKKMDNNREDRFSEASDESRRSA